MDQEHKFERLPSELLSTIFSHVNPQDVYSLRRTCSKFNAVVLHAYKYLPRTACKARIFDENGTIRIENKKCDSCFGKQWTLAEFDFSFWDEVSIVEVEFRGLTAEGEQSRYALQSFLHYFVKSRQSTLRSVTFADCILDDSFAELVLQCHRLTTLNCEKVFFSGCKLPVALTKDLVDAAIFENYRNVESEQGNPELDRATSNIVLKKFTREMKLADKQRSFVAEVRGATVTDVCEFIEAWLGTKKPSFFNLSLHECSDVWKMAFSNECNRRQLTHTFLEFASKAEPTAHIKVSFTQNNDMCCIWPIFDLPARTTGQSVCYARYFRDF